MPNRIIRDGFVESERVNSLDDKSEIFFFRLLLRADDFGRFSAHPALLKANLFPLKLNQTREADITRWMAACQKAGLIVLYEVDSKHYLEITRFNQRKRALTSKCPSPDGHMTVTCPSPDGLVGGERREAKSGGEKAVSDGGLPEKLRTPEFETAWSDWQAHRHEKKKPITPTSRREQVASLEEMGPQRAIAALRHSIRNGWTGIFEPEERKNGAHQRSNAESRRNVGTANEGRSDQYKGVGRV